MQKPDQQSKKRTGKIVIEQNLCTGCGLCIKICPKQVLELENSINVKGYHPVSLVREGCSGCALCAQMCPHVAIVEVWR